MNILNISVTTKMGGGTLYLYQLISSCRSKDVNEYFCAPNDGEYFQKTTSIVIDYLECDTRKISILNFLKIYQFAKKNKIDLIHSHGKGAGIYGRMVALCIAKPAIHTFHGFHYHHYGFVKRGIYLIIEKLLTYLSAKIICVSNDELLKATKAMGFSKNNQHFCVIYNGIDSNRLKGANVILRSNIDKRIVEDSFVIISLARITRQKGIIDLVRSASIVCPKYPKIIFVVLGDLLEGEYEDNPEMEYREEIIDLIEKCYLKDKFLILKKRDDALSVLKSANIYTSSSYGEGFSLSLLEAMLLAKPIIATKVTGNTDAIIDGMNGLLVEPTDYQSMAIAIEKLISDQDYAALLGFNAKQYAMKHFSFEAQIKETLSIYREFA